MGRGEKRSFEDDGAETSTTENNFTVTNVKQVKVKKFGTTGTVYTVQFTDTFAHLELSQFHDRLHGIFESLLDSITRDIPEIFLIHLSLKNLFLFLSWLFLI
jgi:hypothetical protein